jgi:Amino acid permease
MMYAFSRDGAIPISKFLNKVDHRWHSPIRAGSSFHASLHRIGQALRPFFFALVWLVCALSFILGLPSFGSSVAFSAATSIATIGLYTSYGTQFQTLYIGLVSPFTINE